MFHKRSKHIAIKYHWVREHVDPEGEERTAVLVHVRTGDQTADMLTKALCGPTFEEQQQYRRPQCRVNTRPPMRVCRNLGGFGG